MPIPTAASLRRQRSKIDAQRKYVERLVERMKRENLSLHLCLQPDGSHWRLSNGRVVQDATARRLVQQHEVIGCGDALFDGALSQVYRVATSEK